MTDLKQTAKEIREILTDKRKELGLTFIEEDHIYYMKGNNGKIHSDWPSVSKVLKLFYDEFPADDIAYSMSKGDMIQKQKLLDDWSAAAEYATNMGSRVHYELEIKLLNLFGVEKEVRKPIFEVDLEQELKSNSMIKGGEKFLRLMEERGAILLDTEMVLGHPELGYTGQPDKVWLIFNREKTNFGIIITDWKTNKPKNFQVHQYTEPMRSPFEKYPNNALGHYYLQIPLYARLLLKMLEGTKYENITFYGGIIVLLKDNNEFEEFRIPSDVTNKVMNLNFNDYGL